MQLHPHCDSNLASTPQSLNDPFAELQQLWEQELQSLQFTPVTRSESPLPSSVRATRRQRNSAQRTTLSKTLSSSVTAPRSAPSAPRRSYPWKPLAVAMGCTLAVVGLAGGAWSAYQHFQAHQVSPEARIRKVMYQNVDAKVAAFRKEIADGEHFVSEHSRPIQYVARSGDTVDKISRKFHLNPQTIIKNNDRKKLGAAIKPGTPLTILPVDGIAHPVDKNETIAEISKRYQIAVNEIISVNHMENPHLIREKQKLIIPNATELRLRPKPKPQPQAVKYARAGEGSTPVVKSGRRLSWPSAGSVTSNYGWRWFRMHNGMDIAAPVGTPIRAAKEGRVVYSGWMGGYGYAIDLDHGNGVVTRYAHCSELKVRQGQYVSRGQLIAAMGSTGHSTGSHLHFEVHVNGSPINPRAHF